MIAPFLREKDDALGDSTPRHLSHSRVSRYLLCPEQYRLYYLEGLRPATPPSSLVFGNIVHQALAQLFAKAGNGTNPAAHFTEMWAMLKTIPLQYKERESWDKLNTAGAALLAKFVKEEFPKLTKVSAVEKPFTLNVTSLDQPFVGIIDLVAELEGNETVVDFKTAGASYDAHEAVMSDQLTAYQLAEPQIRQAGICVLVKTKEPRIEWHLTTRTGARLSEYLAKVGYVAHEIAAGRFYKRPGMWCSWCEFLPVCLGDKQKAQETLVKIA